MAQAGKKKKTWPIILCLAVLAAAAAGAWYYFNRPEETVTEIETVSIDKAQVGDIVLLGSYEQDNDPTNGEEAIPWIVMADEEGKLLLLSYYGLDNKQYNSSPQEITWEACEIRTWLNQDFYLGHFTEEEKSQIQLSHLSTEDNIRWGTDGGPDTEDYVFLLSTTELAKYTGEPLDEANPAREAQPTAYAIENGSWYSGLEGFEKNCIFWWTRSPGPRADSVSCVMGDGVVMDGNQSCYVSQDHFSIRPALWLDRTK